MAVGKKSESSADILQSVAPHLTSQWRSSYRRKLLAWFAHHRRDLPWRETSDPYAIWISESMLQQTQVATVIDYYRRFLKRFPTVHALAEADEQEVLALWAGLGYYRRARQLHAAAQQVVAQHGGQFPASVDQLEKLPGIGRYTAGAIASIAYDLPAPIVEANTQRVYARLLKLASPSSELLWQFAQWQLPATQAGTLNQAAMELGSLICKPVAPLCMVCPVLALCPTASAGLQNSIPAPKPKKQLTALHHVALVSQRQGRWLVRQNPAGAWWHGLWDFPRVDITTLQFASNDHKTSQRHFTPQQLQQVARLANDNLFSTVVITQVHQTLMSLSHGVTRYRIQLDCLPAEVDEHALALDASWQWADRATLDTLPLTSTAKKMVQKLSKHVDTSNSGFGHKQESRLVVGTDHIRVNNT